jgi:hypothetical protein
MYVEEREDRSTLPPTLLSLTVAPIDDRQHVPQLLIRLREGVAPLLHLRTLIIELRAPPRKLIGMPRKEQPPPDLTMPESCLDSLASGPVRNYTARVP